MVVLLPFNKMKEEWTEPKGKYKLKHPGNSEQQGEELVPLWEGDEFLLQAYCYDVWCVQGVSWGGCGISWFYKNLGHVT